MQVERKILAGFAVEPVRKAVRLDRMETFVIEHRLYEAAGRRIAVHRGDDVGAKRLAERRLIFQRIVIGLTNEVGGDVGVVEPLTDAVGDRSLERVVVQDVLVDEGGELWLAACDVLRFAADARPDRIDLIKGPRGPRLILSHERRTPGVSRSPHRSFITFSQLPSVRKGAKE